ncbi:MAG: enoyl-CoA hydratase/isomerase family protein [Aureliella sp.]
MIDVKVNGSTGTILLDNPKRGNALTRSMISELSQAIDDLRQERKVRGIVLAGSGTNFCTGLDLKEISSSADDPQAVSTWHADVQKLCDLFKELLMHPKPIIAAVDGPALGVGLSLALCCDLIVASHRSRFGAASAQRGIVSGFNAPLLHFRIGAAIAAQLLIGGRELPAAEAKDIGLIQHVVDSDQVWVRSSTWVDEIAKSPHEAIQLTKRVLNEMIGEQLLTQLSSGAAALATSLTTEVAQEGVKAFCEGREPNFPG